MTQELEITVLGCGNSTGVPAIGNYWGACDPNEPKNRRTRASIAVKSATTTIIIDTGPDFREQCNRENIADVDAVLYTHHHSDHVMGIDELRVLKFRNQKDCIPIYLSMDTLEDLETRFTYLFKGGNHKLYPPIVQTNIIPLDGYGKIHKIGDIEFIPFEQDHGSCTSLGYRFGDFAYSVDILNLDETAIQTLQGIKTWMVDCAAYKDDNNAVHASIDKIKALNERVGARNIHLTCLSLAADYKTCKDELPNHISPSYDSQKIRAMC